MLLSLRFVVQINRKGFMNESRKMKKKKLATKIGKRRIKKTKTQKMKIKNEQKTKNEN